MLHEMLEDAEKFGFEDVVSWQLDGYGFKVIDKQEFVGKVLPKYFNQASYKSFLRQVNLYGFSRISKSQAKGGHAGGCYFHKHFVRGQKQLCAQINRQTAKKSRGMDLGELDTSTQSSQDGSKRASGKKWKIRKNSDANSSYSASSDGQGNDNDNKAEANFLARFQVESSTFHPPIFPYHNQQERQQTQTTVSAKFGHNRNAPFAVAVNQQGRDNVFLPSRLTRDTPPLGGTNKVIVPIHENIIKDPNIHTFAGTYSPFTRFDEVSFFQNFAVPPDDLDSAKNLLESVDLFKKSDESSSEDNGDSDDV
jgi:hypothetical protein